VIQKIYLNILKNDSIKANLKGKRKATGWKKNLFAKTDKILMHQPSV
jgi:hypothetical protein